MSSKPLLVVLVLALAYAGFILAHRQFDRPIGAGAPGQTEDEGLTRTLRPLLTEGIAALPRVRAALAEEGDEGRALLAILPREDEPWVARLGELRETSPSEREKISLRIVAPRGLQVRRDPVLHLIRELPGSAVVEVLPAEGEDVLAEQKLPVNRPAAFPAELELESGRSYRLRARDMETAPIVSETSFVIATPEQLKAIGAAATTLKIHVDEARLRVYLQAAFAMSRGFDDEAYQLLTRSLPMLDAPAAPERGILERLAVLHDARGDPVARERALAAAR